MAELDVVTAGIPEVDDCPVLTQINAFLVQEGVCATLEHVFRDRRGQPLDLDDSVDVTVSEGSDSSATSESDPTDDSIVLRIKEITPKIDGNKHKIHEVEGTIVDGNNGVVRAMLPASVIGRAGIYQLSWGFYRDGKLLAVNEALLSVERTLFGFGSPLTEHTDGPPTINSIRLQIMDSAAQNLLLDDVEFSDAQIIEAIVKPVQEWEEKPPPLSRRFTTFNFPYRHHWVDATIGYLLRFAAHNYRRNQLATNAGGVTIDDKNKERPYLTASELMLKEWRDFIINKKVSLNAAEMMGHVPSDYAGL